MAQHRSPMCIEETQKQPPLASTLSHLFRILAEKDMTDQRLNKLVQLGFLDDLFSVPIEELSKVNRGNLKRVLRIALPPQEEKAYRFYAEYYTPLDQLLRKAAIFTLDGRHNEPKVEEKLNGEMEATLRHVKGSRYGAAMRTHEENGESPATLSELISFANHISVRGLGDFPIFALGTRLSNPHPQRPEVFCLEQTGSAGNVILKHVDSYSQFPAKARFLGVRIPI